MTETVSSDLSQAAGLSLRGVPAEAFSGGKDDGANPGMDRSIHLDFRFGRVATLSCQACHFFFMASSWSGAVFARSCISL